MLGSWCAGWRDCSRESVLGKSLALGWSGELALKLREAALEPQRELNPNQDPAGSASGDLHSLGTGRDFAMSLPSAWAVPLRALQPSRTRLQTSEPYFTVPPKECFGESEVSHMAPRREPGGLISGLLTGGEGCWLHFPLFLAERC